MFGNKVIETINAGFLLFGGPWTMPNLPSGINTNTITPSGATGAHQKGIVGQCDFVGNGSNSVTATVYNDNITDNSIVVIAAQGAITANGPFVAGITTAPSTSNKNFTTTIQRRLTATITTSEHIKLNYWIFN
jgi:hypothetical protein